MSTDELDLREIEELRDLLEARRIELEAQLTGNDAATKPVMLDQQSVGRVSRIDAIQQQQMAIASQQQAGQQLQRIELALQRIDKGEYGYCQQCQEPIALLRLRAQPFASLCLDCQSDSESA